MTEQLHILLVTYEFPPEMATGGIGSYMHNLAGLLFKHGHTVTVFSATFNKNAPGLVDRGYCNNYLLFSGSENEFRKDAVSLFKELIKVKPVDVIESPEVGACALDIKKAYPEIPLIVKLHTPGVLITKVSNTYQGINKKLRFVLGALRRGRLDLGYWSNIDRNKNSDPEYQLCLLADQIISPSLALKKWISKYWDLPPGRINVVPNPFAFNDALYLIPLENRPCQVCFVGKLSVLKGMIALTTAIPLILTSNPECHILIVGRDEKENGRSMKAYMQEKLAKFLHRISFTGPLSANELVKIYGESRVCIVPSLWENYPTVVLEAMAAGTTVVAACRGGIPEMIEDGLTGKLFNPLNPVQLATAVRNLLSDDRNRIEMAANARRNLLQKQDSNSFEERILAPYIQLGLRDKNE